MNDLKSLKTLEESSRAKIVDPVTRKTIRKAFTGPNAAKPKRKYKRRQKVAIEPSNELKVQFQPYARPVIQLNLELPATMSHQDIEALINLVTEKRSSTQE